MKKGKFQNVTGLLVKVGMRPAGEMLKNGEKISWKDEFQIVIIPLEEESGKSFKYVVEPPYIEKIERQLDEVHWGCLVQLALENRHVTAVEILDDILSDYYEE